MKYSTEMELLEVVHHLPKPGLDPLLPGMDTEAAGYGEKLLVRICLLNFRSCLRVLGLTDILCGHRCR